MTLSCPCHMDPGTSDSRGMVYTRAVQLLHWGAASLASHTPHRLQTPGVSSTVRTARAAWLSHCTHSPTVCAASSLWCAGSASSTHSLLATCTQLLSCYLGSPDSPCPACSTLSEPSPAAPPCPGEQRQGAGAGGGKRNLVTQAI